jgi:hypothetical protein
MTQLGRSWWVCGCRLVRLPFLLAERGCRWRPGRCCRFAQGCAVRSGELGEPGAQDPVVDAGEEHGMPKSGAGDLIAVGVRDALDKAALAEPAQIIDRLAGRDRSRAVGRAGEVVAEQAAQVLIQEPAGVQPEDQQDGQQCLGVRVGQAQPGDTGAVAVDDGIARRAQDAVPGDGVVAESLDGEPGGPASATSWTRPPSTSPRSGSGYQIPSHDLWDALDLLPRAMMAQRAPRGPFKAEQRRGRLGLVAHRPR